MPRAEGGSWKLEGWSSWRIIGREEEVCVIAHPLLFCGVVSDMVAKASDFEHLTLVYAQARRHPNTA